MATEILKAPVKEKAVDWVNPRAAVDVTLDDYRTEMKDAELSGFISFEAHKRHLNSWLAEKLQQFKSH
ncbi:MAG: hypothetical protein LBT35_05400 [Tannerella sp.]|jgi:hypothetical protein|nr:hypothetical protein [Tannerella sp.]